MSQVSDTAAPAPPAVPAPPVTHRRVVTLALPMMLANVTTPLLGLVGATVIGRLGEAHLLAAVALGAAIFDVLFWSFGAVRMATTGLTAQAVGARDTAEVDRILARALLIAGIVAVLMLVLQAPIGALAFRLAGASEAVTEALSDYFFARIWSTPFTLVNYVILGSVLGRGRTDLGFLLQLAINLANIGLTLLFVLQLHLGVAGAAWASVLAEAIGAALGLALVLRLGSNPLRVRPSDLLDWPSLARMLVANGDILVRTLALVGIYAFFSAQSARAGDVTLAANAVLQNIWMTGGYVLDGFATAAEALCGRALGAGDTRGFRRGAMLSTLWCLAAGAAISLFFWFFGSTFIDIVTTSPEVRLEARRYLVFAALTPLVTAPAFALDGVFIGATWTRPMRNLMLAALAVFAASFLALRPLGNSGLWLSMLIFLAARGIGQTLAFPGLVQRAFAKP